MRRSGIERFIKKKKRKIFYFIVRSFIDIFKVSRIAKNAAVYKLRSEKIENK